MGIPEKRHEVKVAWRTKRSALRWTPVWGPVANPITCIPQSHPIVLLWVVSAPGNHWPHSRSIMSLKSMVCNAGLVQLVAAGLYQYVCPFPVCRDGMHEKCHRVHVLLFCQSPGPPALSIRGEPRVQTHDQGYIIRDDASTIQIIESMTIHDVHVPLQTPDDSCLVEGSSALFGLLVSVMRIGHISGDDVRIPSECGWRS